MRYLIHLLLLSLALPLAATAQDCVLGNQESVGSYDAGWIVETARFAHFVDPMAAVCSCTPGVRIEDMAVRLYLEAGAGLMLRAHLHDDAGTPECPTPGQLLASSELFLAEPVERRDLYTISIPSAFQCALKNETYFLVVEVLALTGTVEIPYTQSDTGIDKVAPGEACSAWRDVGAGWEDMIDGGFPGGLPISVTTTCCGEPIPDGSERWGDVKQYYE